MYIIPATWEVEIRGSWFMQAKSLRDPISKNKLGVVVQIYNLSYARSLYKRITD
jgi:hypothetical protein